MSNAELKHNKAKHGGLFRRRRSGGIAKPGRSLQVYRMLLAADKDPAKLNAAVRWLKVNERAKSVYSEQEIKRALREIENENGAEAARKAELALND